MMISVAHDFAKRPGHRSHEDGDNSGEEFLAKILRPKYVESKEKNESLVVNLDGASGYSTSFLEAAFGGLAREFPVEEVRARIHIISTIEKYLIEEINQYIEEARASKSLFA